MFIVACVLTALIAWGDRATGWELSLFIFYAIPILFVVWYVDRRSGLAFAVISGVMWWIANEDENPYHTTWGYLLAAFSRMLYFLMVAIGGAAVKSQQDLQRDRIEALERTGELEREILRTSEREQQRIGRDLHDGLGPHLAAIGVATKLLSDELQAREQPEAKRAEAIQDLVKDAVFLTRGLARGIFPIQMDGTGLAAALEDLASTTGQLSRVAVTFQETGAVQIEDLDNAMHLYRIAQEALGNALKHGEATSVLIALSQDEGNVRLVIADNGRGMGIQDGKGLGMGLRTMSYRARAILGELDIQSHPDEGTVVTCSMPHSSRAKAISP